MSSVHLVVPDGVADPLRPSGGNTYDLRAAEGLSSLGWDVTLCPVAGAWPRLDDAGRAALGGALAGIPDGGTALVDGLVASAAPEVLGSERARIRLVALVHLPLGVASERSRRRERGALAGADVVVTTGRWSRDWLLSAYGLEPRRVRAVLPGVAPAALSRHDPGGGRLLCVGAVSATKGHDLLVDALHRVGDLDWSCRCVGSLTVEPVVAARVRASAAGMGERLTFSGPLVGDDLCAVYAAADLLLVPSRVETYGLVVTEALARGVPVLGADVGGLPEALGVARDGRRPGVLVPADDPSAWAAVLRRWLTDAALRRDLRRAAGVRRAELRDWSATAADLSQVLAEVAAEVAA